MGVTESCARRLVGEARQGNHACRLLDTAHRGHHHARWLLDAAHRGHHHARWLLDAARRGDRRAQEELARRYEPLVHRVVRRLKLPPCCQFEDLAQEARIGLLTALREWEPERGPFAAFAARCMTSQALRALQSACSHKHQVLNRAQPLEGTDTGSNSSDTRMSSSEARMGSWDAGNDPEYRLLVREELTCLVSAMPTLTASERAALAGTLNGHSHARLGQEIGGTPKAAAQAVYRARRKLAAALSRATSLG